MDSKFVDGEKRPKTQTDIDRRLSQQLTPNQLLQRKREGMVATPWQFRKAINQLGLRARVEELVTGADQDTKDGWEMSTRFERLHPLVVQFGSMIPLSDKEIDGLFELAITL